MAKRKSVTERHHQRENARRRKNLATMVVSAAVIVAVVAVVLLTASTSSDSVDTIRLDLDPMLGNPDASVTVVEFGAYGCPSCRVVHQQRYMERLLEEFPDQVRIVFRDLPIISPTYDNALAQFAQCALDQGNAYFWQIHDIFYTQFSPTGGIPSTDTLVNTAEQIGMDGDEIRTCYEAGTHRTTVSYDQRRAQQLGLNGTPAFLVNEQRVFLRGYDDLQAAVVQALGT